MMIDKVDELFKQNNFSLKDKSIVIAVSAGMDSMSMLTFFCENKEYYGIKEITVAHFNHNLRDEESNLDEQFVKDYCKHNNVECITENGLMSSKEKPKGHTIESWARELRYSFLSRVASLKNSLIFTAHTMNDSVETVLFNLTRGTGLKGCSGISFMNGEIVRPFLNITRDEIVEYVEEKSIPFRNDSTNALNIYSRNRIRNNVIPELLSVNSKAIENISGFSNFVNTIDIYLTEQSDILTNSSYISEDSYSKKILLEADSLILSYSLKGMLEVREIKKINEKIIKLMMSVVKGELNSVEIEKDIYFSSNNDNVFFSKKDIAMNDSYSIHLDIGDNETPFGRIALDKTYRTETNNYTSQNMLDCDKIVGKLFIRNRANGDRFTSSKRGQTKSIKKLFNERKIPNNLRSSLPLLVDDIGIIWIPNEGVSSRVVVDDNTKNILTISFSEVKHG